MAGTIAVCKNKECHSEYQDRAYGQKKRVFNHTMKKQGNLIVGRCTVCRSEQALPKSDTITLVD